MSDERQLSFLIGSNAKNFRTKAGLTLNDVSIAARNRGLKWSQSRVADFERGDVAPNLATLLAVCLALQDAGCSDATLPALFKYRGGRIAINDSLELYDFDICRLLAGKRVEEVPSYEEPSPEDLAADFSLVKTAWERWIADTLDSDLAAIVRVRKASGATEERVRKSLGISSMLLTCLSATLWNATFSAERDRRAGEGANAQKRGQITRAMVDELRDDIRKREKGGPRRRGNRK